MVNDARIVRRDDKRGNPLATQRRLTLGSLGNDGDSLAGAQVGTRNRAIKARRVNDVRVGGVNNVATPLSAWGTFECNSRDPVAPSAQINHSATRAMVLNRSVNVERIVHVDTNVEELHQWQVVVECLPCDTRVVRKIDPAVVDVHQVVGIVRIDPQAVVIPVHSTQRSISTPAVVRDV